MNKNITVFNGDDFKALNKAGRLAGTTLDYITQFVKEGVSTLELDELLNDFILSHGAKNAITGYRGYPRHSCISLNHVVCHGIPAADKKLAKGDILNIDITLILDGYYADTSRMYTVDKSSIKAKKLVDVTYDCMMEGIKQVRPGAHLGDIGYAIQSLAEENGFSVVVDFCGHGIGKEFHTAPNILHYGRKGDGMEIVQGMVFTIEPMINAGGYDTKVLSDGWTAVTRDKSLSAQFEHTIGVTNIGCEIFTLSPKGWSKPPYE